jgi:hypothetical protein
VEDEKTLSIARATLMFVVGYVALTIIGFASYYLLAIVMHVSLAADFNIATDPAYMLSQQLNIVYNLAVWTACAWLYFRGLPAATVRRAWALGAFWLAVALPADLVFYVLIPTPTQLTAHEYYVGQFPWIYLVYAVLVVSPACYLLLTRRRRTE